MLDIYIIMSIIIGVERKREVINMRIKEIKENLNKLGFEDYKYYEIRDFLKSNRTPMKAITRIERGDYNTAMIELDNEFIVEC